MSDPVTQGGYFIGLMSGTSLDGIDAALLEFRERHCTLAATVTHDYPRELRRALQEAVGAPGKCDVDTVGSLDRRVGECFRDAALALLRHSGRSPRDITAIGSHGQTLRHQPQQAFTLQIGDPNIIAAGTGITTVADFRRRDVALGGQGAPLTPAFHRWLFGHEQIDRVILNIGGIANITVLPAAGGTATGFDTGPGNTLMDAWIRAHGMGEFDTDGAWAASGTISPELLGRLLQDEYFSRMPPKSTGPEHFNEGWLQHRLESSGTLAPEDVQATLAALTAQSIAATIGSHAPAAAEVLVCGGGAHNGHLLEQLRSRLPATTLATTDAAGLHPDWVEAAAFAWLGRRCLQHLPGNLPSLTGASADAILGGIYLGTA